jgi:hypothetical protein
VDCALLVVMQSDGADGYQNVVFLLLLHRMLMVLTTMMVLFPLLGSVRLAGHWATMVLMSDAGGERVDC